MPKKFIRIEGWVTEHAQQAYESKNFIEALQVLHGWIENKLQELLILTGSIDHDSEMSRIWDIANQINLVTTAHVLFVLSQLTEKEYQMIIKFNGIRNQFIHKIYHDPYEKIYEGFPKEKYDEAFKIGMELSDILQRKTEDKIE
ncbi:MAG: hypothetical protein M0P58_13205 [Bacteroidales bacterium]|nr:hypothetical protein [Bacteroidales bacterium]